MSSWAGIDEFLAVAQCRSFTLAARKLGCSASQISREIARLEDRLGQKLFYRTTRHVSLTESGERFLVRCRRLAEERDEALNDMLDQAEALQGELRMTCAVSYGERFIVPVVQALMHENPRLSVDLILTDEMLDLVGLGLDLAIRFGRLRDSRLVATRLTSRTRRLCGAPSYLRARGTPQHIEDLAAHECLRGALDMWVFNCDGREYAHRPQGRFRCNSGHAALQAALGGLGLCRLPDFYVRAHLERGDLVEVLEHHRPEDEGVWAVYPDRRHVPAKVRAVVERLHRDLPALDASGRAPTGTAGSRKSLAPV